MQKKRHPERLLFTWLLAAFAVIQILACGSDEPEVSEAVPSPVLVDPGQETQGDEPTLKKGILEEILKNSEAPSEKDPKDYALAVLRGLYRDGELRGVLDAFAWRRSGCRIGTYSCNAIETLPRRVGAIVAMIPSVNLRPAGMDAKAFETEIEGTLRILEPAPDKALPYIPGEGEGLLTYRDHHGLNRYLLLIRAGSTWRIGALAGGADFKASE